jgi:hypothetical protein
MDYTFFSHTHNMLFKLATYMVDHKGSLEEVPRLKNRLSTMNLEVKLQSQLKYCRVFGT